MKHHYSSCLNNKVALVGLVLASEKEKMWPLISMNEVGRLPLCWVVCHSPVFQPLLQQNRDFGEDKVKTTK